MRNRERKGRRAVAFAALGLLLPALLAGCVPQAGSESGAAGAASGSESEAEEHFAASLSMTPQEYPRVDGSTLTIAFSEAAASAVMKLPIEEARLYVLHNKTHPAYTNLIDGKADLIFVTPPSEDEAAYAAENGVELELIPMLNDAFVFLVNEANPVDGLSRDALRDIYAGAITNWREVGGSDAAIVAYQRPENSGSQTAMLD
ncbi:MAG: substrate-binding domain-containing protein, partial [Clostridiales Family XIII bacterium]|nr:substrate-binding domain-containing protein [Clostridiales Family XIII bacterium]